MKSRKLKAVLAAVSALAVLATAMTGFAATTTTYGTGANVTVDVDIEAEAGKEVTYLVKNASGEGGVADGIVYIDQATANDQGIAEFSYQINKEKMDDNLLTTVTVGTNGSTAVSEGAPTFTLVESNVGTGFKVEYFADDAGATPLVAYGTTETVAYARVSATEANTAIATVSVNGDVKEGVTDDVFEITTAEIGKITATVESTVVTPGFTAVQETQVLEDFTGFSGENFGDEFKAQHAGKTINATIMSVKGTPYQVGVIYNDVLYPAMSSTGNVAVILLSDGETVKATPYYIAEAGGSAEVYEN